MVRRLVEDMIRRTPVWPGAFFALGLVFGWDTLLSRGKAPAAMAVSLVATFAIGPIAMLARLQTPLIPYLPVSRRDIWRARWLMSTVAAAALTTALQLPGTLVTGAWSTWTLSAAMNLLYAGAGCAVIAARDAHSKGGAPGPITLAVLLFGLVSPIAVHASLPPGWLNVGPVHLAVFGAGLAVTAWSAFHTGVTRVPAFRPRPASSTAVVSATGRDRLSGLPRLLAHEFV